MALVKLRDPATAKALAALAAQTTPQLLEMALGAAGLVPPDRVHDTAARLHRGLQGCTEERITKFASWAARLVSAAKRVAAFFKWWRRYADARVCLILGLWIHGTITTPATTATAVAAAAAAAAAAGTVPGSAL